jgi:hypothetical protein
MKPKEMILKFRALSFITSSIVQEAKKEKRVTTIKEFKQTGNRTAGNQGLPK